MAVTTLNTEHGAIQLEKNSWGEAWSAKRDGAQVELLPPDPADVDELETGFQISCYSGDYLSADECRSYSALLAWSAEVIDLFNQSTLDSGQVLAAQEAEKRREEEEERERERMEQVWQDREELLLTEFLDEKGRARVINYKGMSTVIIRVQERGDGTFKPVLEWVLDADWQRTTNVRHIRRMELKVRGKYHIVWDDGDGDLPQYDRGASYDKDRPKYDGALHQED
jgi:hypothetical protein